jgi:hypothetical protein
MQEFVVASQPSEQTFSGWKPEPSGAHSVSTLPLHRWVPAVHIGATQAPSAHPVEQSPVTTRLNPSAEQVATCDPLQTSAPGVQIAAFGTQLFFWHPRPYGQSLSELQLVGAGVAGQPVAARTVARHAHDKRSPATLGFCCD